MAALRRARPELPHGAAGHHHRAAGAVGAALAIALLAAPPATGSPSATPLDAAWTGFSADLLGLRYLGDGSGGSLDLEAASVVVEAESVRTFETAATAYYLSRPRTDDEAFGASTWRFGTTGGNSSLFIVATRATLAADVGSSRISLPDATCLKQPWHYESPRGLACVPMDASTLATSSSSEWRIEGDFQLVLWEWEGAADGESGARTWSGARPTTANAMGQGEYVLRQLYLTVTNGSLHLRPGSASPVVAAVASVGFAASSLGAVGGHETPAGTPVTIARGGDGGLVTTTGTPDLPHGGSGSSPLWIAAVAAGVVLAVAPMVVGTVRRRASLRRLELCQRNLELGNFHAAGRHAWRVRHPSVAVEGAVLGAVASLRAGSAKAAQAFLTRLHGLDRHDEATCSYMRAELLVLQGRRADAEAALEDCLELDPTFGAEAAGNPVLAPFLDPRRWPAVGA